MSKHIVFVIMPFGEDFLALYDNLKNRFRDDFEFTNSGDLDNQQNILHDIVEGIAQADVVIADLTGLNANVFYELGLTHTMNKKVVIITQDLSELPFDIKSYRANEYSLQFNKIDRLIDELEKLLKGAIDDSVKYGNPVFDYMPNYFKQVKKQSEIITHTEDVQIEEDEKEISEETVEEGERGFIDFLVDIQDNMNNMNVELKSISDEMNDMIAAVDSSTKELNRVKNQSGAVDPTFTRKICKKLAEPIGSFAQKLDSHIDKVSDYWGKVENDYLSLLENKFIKNSDNIREIEESSETLGNLQLAIRQSDEQIDAFMGSLQSNMGIERKLNSAITKLANGLGRYLSVTETMSSSIDRILSKSDVVVELAKK